MRDRDSVPCIDRFRSHYHLSSHYNKIRQYPNQSSPRYFHYCFCNWYICIHLYNLSQICNTNSGCFCIPWHTLTVYQHRNRIRSWRKSLSPFDRNLIFANVPPMFSKTWNVNRLCCISPNIALVHGTINVLQKRIFISKSQLFAIRSIWQASSLSLRTPFSLSQNPPVDHAFV